MEKRGFDYYLEKEVLKNYIRKSPEEKLRWLFMGNKLRKHAPLKIRKMQDKFRRGEI